MNNNEKLIADLTAFAEYLKTHPDFPIFNHGFFWRYCSTKEDIKSDARQMGSFDKVYDDYNLKLIKKFGSITVESQLARDQVCRKVVTWEGCDDEALLAEIGGQS